MPLTEIDTRTIPGNGGEVAWDFWNDAPAPCHVITILDGDGSMVAVLKLLDGREALDAFRHTFARPEVPDVFARERS